MHYVNEFPSKKDKKFVCVCVKRFRCEMVVIAFSSSVGFMQLIIHVLICVSGLLDYVHCAPVTA